MNTHHAINYIEFVAEDFTKVKEFYSKAFGWELIEYGSEYMAFKDGSTKGDSGGFGKGAPQAGGALVILYSDDLEASLKTVEENGGVISKPIFNFPGGRRFHFIDPSKNELAVWSEK